MGALKRLRPRTHDQVASAAQLVLELGAARLRPETKADLTELLSSVSPEPWVFVMLSREKARLILKRINEGDRSGSTAKVWMAALSFAEYGTGAIAASRSEIADVAGTTEREVSRALSRLAEIQALIRTGKGRYALHPQAAWSGTLATREKAVAELTPAE